ncbi:MAG: 4-hydroxythreonine-4-phosphate dehydrogenase PdxA [Bacteroidales bacterium]|nr:4-hydroxythreonine-4-phosphate dehydrogenase PdxA [Bacteroidales bacterium]
MKNRDQIIAGITHGDINGVGYEVIIKTLADNRVMDSCIPVVYGSPKVAAYHRKALNISNFSFNNVRNAEEANPKRANIINCLDDNVRVELGKSTEMAGVSAIKPLEMAVDDLAAERIDIIVTAPINKFNIQSENFNFPGHTEYLKHKFDVSDVLMLLVSDNLRVGVVTGHIPLKDVPSGITKELVVRKIEIMNKSLIMDFGIRKPRIAVLSLNPHSGDSGLLGEEENEIIMPAIEEVAEKGILAFGTYPSDGFFGSSAFTNFDGVLAMYHDQGLTPFKALAMDEGVNYTAGLPVIRTSPSHGTAYELAGEGRASEKSFRKALFLGCDIYKNRKMYDEINSNPLKHHNLDTRSEVPDELPPDEEPNNEQE